jgi:putative PIN family toxin of toxin-antitoxin system
MTNNPFYTVLDTNILFAGLYSRKGASFAVLQAVAFRKLTPVLSVALLFEYEDVLKRNSRKLGFNFREIDAFLDNICLLGSFQKIHYLWRPFLADPKDDHVLELAVASQVKNITTFNVKDFKGADKFGVKILGPKDLLEVIRWER